MLFNFLVADLIFGFSWYSQGFLCHFAVAIFLNTGLHFWLNLIPLAGGMVKWLIALV